MRDDFTRHNEEVRRVWDAYHAGKPIRVPVGNFTIGPRIWLLNPSLNTTGITMERFSTDPEVMFQVLLEYKHYLHHHVPHDIEMGIPADGWEVFVEFNNAFDTGFPIDFSALREQVGDEVHINGGVHVDILLRGSPAAVRAEVRRILGSGIMRGGKFVMKEANNMPPCTPEENIRAMYEATRELGAYAGKMVEESK